MEARRTRGKRIAVAVVTSSLGIGMAAVVLEMILRFIPVPAVDVHRHGAVRHEDQRAFFSYDPELGWIGMANAEGWFSGWEFRVHAHLNGLGFRSPQLSRDKPTDRYRVLVFGDSITWGYGVEEGERFTDLLPAMLSTATARVDVINLAINGYDTGQELLLYRRIGASFCPDLVLVGLYGNDLRENVSAMQGPYGKPYFRVVGNHLELANVPVPQSDGWTERRQESSSHLKAWMRERVRLYALAGWLRETFRQWLHPTAFPVEVVAAEATEFRVTALLLQAFERAVRQDGGQFAVVILPDVEGLRQGELPPPHIAAAQSSLQHVWDITESFRQASVQGTLPLFYRFDGAHWTSRAHELATQQIAQFLKQTSFFRNAPRQCSMHS